MGALTVAGGARSGGTGRRWAVVPYTVAGRAALVNGLEPAGPKTRRTPPARLSPHPPFCTAGGPFLFFSR